MTVRQLVYPDYDVEAHETGDIFFRFIAPGSKFGPVIVVLAGPDAEGLADLLDKAILKSWQTA